jgi:hypothetical protein
MVVFSAVNLQGSVANLWFFRQAKSSVRLGSASFPIRLMRLIPGSLSRIRAI